MGMVLKGAVKMQTTTPGRLPQHYECDLIIKNYEDIVRRVVSLKESMAALQKATMDLQREIASVNIDLADKLSLVLDDGTVFDNVDHALTLSGVMGGRFKSFWDSINEDSEGNDTNDSI